MKVDIGAVLAAPPESPDSAAGLHIELNDVSELNMTISAAVVATTSAR